MQAADNIKASWRALRESDDEQPGWRSITMGPSGRFRAGVLFPERNEALIAGFGTKRKLLQAELPSGLGFLVQQFEAAGLDNNRRWFSLSRRDGADPQLFLTMACSVLESLVGRGDLEDEEVLQTNFLQRIRAWQRFMQRSAGLDREREVGLHGELIALDQLLDHGCPIHDAVGAWEGPLDGLHDFVLGTVAIEVKSTAARSGFPVTIGSLEQLDTPTDRRLVLSGIRVCEQDSGLMLPERVGEMRKRLGPVPSAAQMFENRLLGAGYLDTDAEQFTKRFSFVERRNLEIIGDFPRLGRSSVPPAIREARYQLDLDLIATPRIGSDELKKILGLQS